MIPGARDHDSDGSDHEPAGVTRADQVRRNDALRDAICFGLEGRKESSAAKKLNSLLQGNQCMKIGNSCGENYTMRCATCVKSLRLNDDWTNDKVPWPKGHEKWSNVKKS